MNTAVLFSKASDEWATPSECFAPLDAEFGFSVDAAASAANAKCLTYYGLDGGSLCRGDALQGPWTREPHWLNPPYSQCRAFLAKAAAERRRGVLTVALVPARTDTRWFHEHLWDADRHRPQDGIELRFVRGRLRFVGATNSAPFPSMIVVFRP